jgi:2-polyprenyl-6-methoxyphenol hydroxylase-like FAD-dependent oxidoreductase
MKPDIQHYDVLILGAGPAGSTTSLLLERSGLRVALVDIHRSKNFVVGESLPSQSRPLLEQLGLWTKFKEDGHRPYYGNQSTWGHNSLISTDFINSP